MKRIYLLAILFSFAAISCNKKGTATKGSIKPMAVTETTFDAEVVNSDIPVVVDFWASWCGPCKQMEPDLVALANEYRGKVKFVKVNADKEELPVLQYGVNALPTVLIFKDGQVADYSVGLTTKGTLKNKIEGVLAR